MTKERTWFTSTNTSDLTAGDLDVLNRAARIYQDRRPKEPLSHLELVVLRTQYRRGMSARDLLDAASGT